MQLLEIIQAMRNNGFPQKQEERLKNLCQSIKVLNQELPLIGRIITRKKCYGGRIEKLEFQGGFRGYLRFVITDCDRDSRSSNSAKTYKRKVFLEELEDVQTF